MRDCSIVWEWVSGQVSGRRRRNAATHLRSAAPNTVGLGQEEVTPRVTCILHQPWPRRPGQGLAQTPPQAPTGLTPIPSPISLDVAVAGCDCRLAHYPPSSVHMRYATLLPRSTKRGRSCMQAGQGGRGQGGEWNRQCNEARKWGVLSRPAAGSGRCPSCT